MAAVSAILVFVLVRVLILVLVLILLLVLVLILSLVQLLLVERKCCSFWFRSISRCRRK